MQIWIINLFSDLPGEGAVEGRFVTLCRVFAERGHSVTWWTMDWHHRTKQRRSPECLREAESIFAAQDLSVAIRAVPVPAYTTNISLRRFRSHRAFARRLLRIAEAGEAPPPDRILASSPPLDSASAAITLGRRFNCPVAVDLTDLWPHTFTRVLPGAPALRQALGNLVFAPLYARAHRIYREADLVSAVSEEYLEEVRDHAPHQSTHLCYIGGEVSAPRPTPQAPRPAPPAPCQFIYVGAMTGSYDLDTLVQAAAELEEEGTAFEIHLAGGGPREPELRRAVEAAGLASRFTFHGFLDATALHDLLGEMDVGLNLIRPGMAITMPHKLSDYLCASLAVINSLTGESEMLLVQAACGCQYAPGDPASLASAIRHYADREVCNNARANATKLAVERFDRSKTYPVWAGAVCALR